MAKRTTENLVARDRQLDQDLWSAKGQLIDTPELQRLLLELVVTLESPAQRAQADQGVSRPSRRSGGRGRGAAIVILVIGLIGIPAGAIAVGSWVAHTGQYGDPSTSTEVIDRSEWLGLDAQDAPAAITSLYDASLPLPAGATSKDVITPIARLLKQMGTVPDGETGHVTIQGSSVQGLFERAARCLWYREWLEADAVGDKARRDAATAGIRDSATWPVTVASDGGGVVDTLKTVGAAAAADDRRVVLGSYTSCAGYYGPVSQ